MYLFFNRTAVSSAARFFGSHICMPVNIGAVPGPSLKYKSSSLYAVCNSTTAFCSVALPLGQADVNFFKKSPTSTVDLVGFPLESLPSPKPANRMTPLEALPTARATEASLFFKANAKIPKKVLSFESKVAYLLRSSRDNVLDTSCIQGWP